jgi:predicted nucleic acid-binding protein
MTLLVLADTAPIYALVDSSDQYHARANEDLRRLRAAGVKVVVAMPVLSEAYVLILRRMGLTAALPWLDEIRSGVVSLTPFEDDYQLAFQRLHRYGDQPLTVVDALLAVLSERLDVPVWSYDHHMDVLGVRRWVAE